MEPGFWAGFALGFIAGLAVFVGAVLLLAWLDKDDETAALTNDY